jgi:hypothetical protein
MSKKNGHLLILETFWKHSETFGNPLHISMRIILKSHFFTYILTKKY